MVLAGGNFISRKVQCGPTIPGSKKIETFLKYIPVNFFVSIHFYLFVNLLQNFFRVLFLSLLFFFVIGGPEVELSKNAYELKMYKGLSFHL